MKQPPSVICNAPVGTVKSNPNLPVSALVKEFDPSSGLGILTDLSQNQILFYVRDCFLSEGYRNIYKQQAVTCRVGVEHGLHIAACVYLDLPGRHNKGIICTFSNIIEVIDVTHRKFISGPVVDEDFVVPSEMEDWCRLRHNVTNYAGKLSDATPGNVFMLQRVAYNLSFFKDFHRDIVDASKVNPTLWNRFTAMPPEILLKPYRSTEVRHDNSVLFHPSDLSLVGGAQFRSLFDDVGRRKVDRFRYNQEPISVHHLTTRSFTAIKKYLDGKATDKEIDEHNLGDLTIENEYPTDNVETAIWRAQAERRTGHKYEVLKSLIPVEVFQTMANIVEEVEAQSVMEDNDQVSNYQDFQNLYDYDWAAGVFGEPRIEGMYPNIFVPDGRNSIQSTVTDTLLDAPDFVYESTKIIKNFPYRMNKYAAKDFKPDVSFILHVQTSDYYDLTYSAFKIEFEDLVDHFERPIVKVYVRGTDNEISDYLGFDSGRNLWLWYTELVQYHKRYFRGAEV
jgi:hypothetical protein